MNRYRGTFFSHIFIGVSKTNTYNNWQLFDEKSTYIYVIYIGLINETKFSLLTIVIDKDTWARTKDLLDEILQ